MPCPSDGAAKNRRSRRRVKLLDMAWRAACNDGITDVICGAQPPSCRRRLMSGMACDSRVAFRITYARHGEGRPHKPGDGGDRFVGPGRPRRRRGAFRGTAGGSRTRTPRRIATVRCFSRRAPQDGGGAQPAHRRAGRHPAGARRALPSRAEPPQHFLIPGLAAGRQSSAAQFSRWGLDRRSIPAKQPVVEPTRRSAGDASRLNRVAARRSSLRFGRNTPGIPPSRALSAGRLPSLGAHAGSTTGCSPRRFASLIVALQSKDLWYSSLARLVSRAPRRSRRSRHFAHRLPGPAGEGRPRGAPSLVPRPRDGRRNPRERGGVSSRPCGPPCRSEDRRSCA